MDSYTFSLNKVRNYKSQVLDKEKRKLAVLQKRRDEISEKIAALGRFRNEKNAELDLKARNGALVSELISCSFIIENARLQLQVLLSELKKAEEEMETQRQVVLSVYQEKTGMDKLEEKQAEEYRILAARSIQNEVLQNISNQISFASSSDQKAG